MRFLRRAFLGIFLISITLAVLAQAGLVLWSAVDARMNAEPRRFQARERVVAANVVEVMPERLQPVLEVYGELRARRTLSLRPSTGGTVIWVAPELIDGGQVAQGAPLLRVDPADFEAEVARAEADLASAQAGAREADRALILAQDELDGAEAQAALRQQALERQRGLQNRGVGTAPDLEAAELALSSAQSTVLSRRQALADAEARIDSAAGTIARARLTLSEARRALAGTEMTAPFAGTLANVTVLVGARVSASEQVAELTDPRDLEVAFRLSAAQFAHLIDGTGALINAPVTVALEVSGLSLAATGQISRESPGGEGQTGRLLYASIGAAPGLRPGDFVTVSITEPEVAGLARLPAAAYGSDGALLVVGGDDRLEAVPAELFRRQGDEVLIRAEGLAGRWVVAERSPLLGAGLKIRPVRAGAEADQAEQAAVTAPVAVASAEAPPPPGDAPRAAAGEMIALDEARRQRLIAFVAANERLPAEAKARITDQLGQPEVPAEVVARLESRMGG